MEQTIIIGAGISNENYRARVTHLETGETLITPIKEGSRGPLYADPLTTTQHGKLTKSTKNWHVAFDIPVTETLDYVADCLEKEARAIVKYIRNSQD